MTGTHNTIIILDGSHIPIQHIGFVILSPHITLQNVLHVLDFQFNLISIQKLCKDLHCRNNLLMTVFCSGAFSERVLHASR